MATTYLNEKIGDRCRVRKMDEDRGGADHRAQATEGLHSNLDSALL
jgi:hypothetical protein